MTELKEVAELFQRAFHNLSVCKSPVTAKALFNSAQSRLDELEKGDGDLAKHVRERRAVIRNFLGRHQKSLFYVMGTHAEFWKQYL